MNAHGRKIKHRLQDRTKIAGFNLHGKLSSVAQREALSRDMVEMNINICILTETRWNEDADFYLPDGGGRIINLPSDNANAHAQYGMGIWMNTEWAERYEHSVKISDRVAIFYFKYHNNTRGHIAVIGVYGPTAHFAETHEGALEAFYAQLGDAYDTHKRKATMVMVVGDFNAKIGQNRRDGDLDIMGKYSIGHRNANGEKLAEFLHEKGLFLSNTAFQHSRHHTATWHGEYENAEGVRRGIHNQIDYIAVQARHKTVLANARSCSAKHYESDHSMVVATFYLEALYPISRRQVVPERKRDLQQLYMQPTLRAEYEDLVRTKMQNTYAGYNFLGLDPEPRERYANLKRALEEAVAEKVPWAPKKVNGKVVYDRDAQLQRLSRENARLWQLYRRTPVAKAQRRANINTRRSRVRHKIRTRIRQLNSEKVNKIAAELEKNRGNRQMYEYARIMQKRNYKPLKLRDAEGFMQSDSRKLIGPVTAFYDSFFNQIGKAPTEKWEGNARPLQNRITADEIRVATSRLNNHWAVGPDKRTAEEFKAGGEPVVEELEVIFNRMFVANSTLPELTEGFLLAMPKPNKPSTVDNTRPLTLLNTIRKILSLVLLNRARVKIIAYVSVAQLGYLPTRSTTEAVWMMQWLRATVERYDERFYILGLDLSKAFDCLDREELLRIFRDEVEANEDEMRILRVLLADTSLTPKIGREVGVSFATTIGTPQGDALSPLLFIVYLECIMRRYHQAHPPRALPGDFYSYYADDSTIGYHDRTPEAQREADMAPHIQNCNCVRCQANHLLEHLPGAMAERNMQMNAAKTECTYLVGDRESRERLDYNILGTNANQDIEMAVRTSKAEGAMRAYFRIWLKKNPISLRTKLRLFQSTVRPHIMQNLHVLPLRRGQMESIDALHRRQLRRVNSIFYPRHMGNTRTYMRCRCRPLSVDIIRHRWQFLGHILRLHPEAPSRKMMAYYFREKIDNTERRRRLGRRPTSLASLLEEELQLLHTQNADRREQLAGTKHLRKTLHINKLAERAADRGIWRILVQNITAEALRRWQAREHARQRRKNEDNVDTDFEEIGEVPEQMAHPEQAARGRRAR